MGETALCWREVGVLQEEVSDETSTRYTTRRNTFPCVVHDGAHSGDLRWSRWRHLQESGGASSFTQEEKRLREQLAL